MRTAYMFTYLSHLIILNLFIYSCVLKNDHLASAVECGLDESNCKCFNKIQKWYDKNCIMWFEVGGGGGHASGSARISLSFGLIKFNSLYLFCGHFWENCITGLATTRLTSFSVQCLMSSGQNYDYYPYGISSTSFQFQIQLFKC